ncbi:MAG: hypothetical protein JRH20_29255, partial [Deltaproteobacteria bacterium]|nr:hypothetical protein [Deltaproteobacteria bacterium]
LEHEITTALGAPPFRPRLTKARERSRVARVALEVAGKGRAAAEKALSDARGDSERIQGAESTLVLELMGIAGRLESSVDSSRGLESMADEVRSICEGARQRRMEARTHALEKCQAATAAREATLESLGLAVGVDFHEVATDVRVKEQSLVHQLAEIDRRLEKAVVIAEAMEAARNQGAIFRELADDFTAKHFPAFLLEEERRALSDLGSQRFELLTAGRYRFAPDGSFDILDMSNAEARRDAKTLSGGETFLASLALALALAERVARSGGRLDAFFLDEGFGSLDPPHLDLALDGIERLVAGAPKRLVVLVSHVEALRDRIDDLIVLDKDGITGDTIVVGGGG